MKHVVPILIIVFVILLVALSLGYFYRTEIIWNYVMPITMMPERDFKNDQLKPIDFSNAENWAALPTRLNEPADITPDGFESDAVDVAVFYIHPSSGSSHDHWNLPLEKERNDVAVGEFFMASQASAFSKCCEVYAPFYRQAAFISFTPHSPQNGDKAINSAYFDVRDAFRYFVDEYLGTRPFIIAGHSQGSGHGLRLLDEEIRGKGLEKRLVAAYLPGFRIRETESLRGCRTREETGCILAWNVFTKAAVPPPGFYSFPVQDGGKLSRKPFEELLCNPPEPDTDLGYTSYLPSEGLETTYKKATCEKGLWRVERPANPKLHEGELARGWLHAYEYAYPWVAIGKDATRRTRAWEVRMTSEKP